MSCFVVAIDVPSTSHLLCVGIFDVCFLKKVTLGA
jgi:hypothetical protein